MQLCNASLNVNDNYSSAKRSFDTTEVVLDEIVASTDDTRKLGIEVGGPYNYEVVGKLIEAAKRTGADYAVDVYPYYGSDVEATLNG